MVTGKTSSPVVWGPYLIKTHLLGLDSHLAVKFTLFEGMEYAGAISLAYYGLSTVIKHTSS